MLILSIQLRNYGLVQWPSRFDEVSRESGHHTWRDCSRTMFSFTTPRPLLKPSYPTTHAPLPLFNWILWQRWRNERDEKDTGHPWNPDLIFIDCRETMDSWEEDYGRLNMVFEDKKKPLNVENYQNFGCSYYFYIKHHTGSERKANSIQKKP